ncbi:MAG: histidine kinase [Saprospiraceae bacterium]|nr:histidine kinase [Saprospiraceae bacterium]
MIVFPSYKKHLFIWIFCAICPLCLLAQNHQADMDALKAKFKRYQHYTMADGLSSNFISCIVQDDDGFIWLGTIEGLNRFDGEHFHTFFYGADKKGLPSDEIKALLKLPNDRLLIGTSRGLCVLNTRFLTFKSVDLPTRTDYKEGDLLVHSLLRDPNGRIWVGTGTGVHTLDDQLNLQQSYFTPQQAGKASYNYFARSLIALPNGLVIIRPDYGPNNARWQTIDFVHQKLIPLSESIPFLGVLDSAKWASSIVVDAHNNLWMAGLGTESPTILYHFDWTTHVLQPLLKNPNPKEIRNRGQVGSPLLLPDSLLLLQRYFGKPIVYNMRDGSLFELDTWRTSFPDGKGMAQFVDRAGNLWLAPVFEGLFFLTLKTLPATAMTALNTEHRKVMKQAQVSEEWFPFTATEQGDKWIIGSGNGGLYSMDKTNMGVTGQVLSNPFKPYAYIFDMTPAVADTVWACTLDGLIWYKTTNNTEGSLKKQVKGLDSLDNKFVYRDHYGLIWGRVANNGVGYFNPLSRQFVPFRSQGANAPFPLTSASAITEDPISHDMWFSFGSEKRYLVRWSRQTGVFEKIEPINKTGKPCTNTQYILADPHHNLWMQNTEGVFRMNTQTLEVKSFGKADGLNTNFPEGFCYDKTGNMWFATGNGLSRYDAQNHKLLTFYKTDGLLANEIARVELIDTVRNILFVSTKGGFCLFEPDKRMTTTVNSRVFLTTLWASDSAYALPESNIWTLPYNQNNLRIEFSSINFINGLTNRYQYDLALEGAEAGWKDAGTDNFANYLNLPHGRYTFRVRTTNSDGLWSKDEAQLTIVIHPPWWQTWSFRLFIIGFLGSIAWWIYQRQIKLIEQRETEKNKVRQQLADLEMKALRSQMNPHFVFNALNSVQNFILKNDPREASRYLTKFARLMRLILENSESPVVPLAKEMELLRYYTELEVLRFSKQFIVDFQVDKALHTESVSIPGMLIQPHIENAIWHGLMHKTDGTGQLIVRVIKINDKTLICEIEDNGVGRAAAAIIEQHRPKAHRSTGLANIRHRLELLNAQLADDIRFDIEDLMDDAGQARGTKVVVRIPIVAR